IADEVMVGFGRIGEWFAFDAYDVAPDLISFAMGVNSGYVPLGGVVIRDEIVEHYGDRPYTGGLTSSGHPLGCAAGVATFEVFERDDILGRVRRLGSEVIAPTVADWASKHPSVGEVRGRGLFWAVELVRSQETREPLVPYNASGADAAPMAELMARCKSAGVWPMIHFNRLQIAPPLVVSEGDLRRGLDVIDEALGYTDKLVA